MVFRISPAVRFTLLPLLVVLGLIGILYFATGPMVSRELSEKISVRVEARAAILARRLAVAVDTHASKAELLAWTLGQIGLRDKSLIRRQLEEVRRRSQAMVWIGVTDLNGQVLVATEGALEGSSIAGRPVFTEGRDKVFFGDFHAPVALKPYLESIGNTDFGVADLGVPVRDAQGRTVGVLTAHLSGNWFSALAQGTVTPAETRQTGMAWHLVLTGGDALPDKLPLDLATAAGADGLAHQARGTDGKDYLMASQRVPLGPREADPFWTVVVTQDVGVAMASAHQIKANLGLTALGATLLLGGIAFFASWNTRHSVARILEAAQQGFEAAGGKQTMPYRDYLEQLAEQLAGEQDRADSGDLLRDLARDARRFRSVIEHFPLGVALSDASRAIQYVNPAFTALFGWTAEQAHGHVALQLLGAATTGTPWHQALHGAPPGEWVARFTAERADGGNLAVQWQVIPLFNRHGVFEGIMSLAQDRSAEVAQQQRAETFAQRLQLFSEAARNHAFILLDARGEVLEWSRGAENLLGLPREQALGRSCAFLFGSGAPAAQRAEQTLRETRAAGLVRLDRRIHRVDGTSFAGAGELYQVQGGPGPACYALVLSDVSLAQAAAARLTQSEARLNAVVSGASDAVICIDARGQVQLFNPAAEAIFQVRADSAIGRTLDWLLPSQADVSATHPGKPTSALQLMHELSGARPLGTGKIEGRRADGRRVELEAAVSRAHIDGQLVFTAILRDVTERARAERALVQYQIELSELAQRLLLQEKETTQRLAQVLHDDLGQTLAAQRLIYDAGTRDSAQANPAWVLRLDHLINEANRQVRQVLTTLRPPLLDEEGLYAALDNEFQQTRQTHDARNLLLRWDGQARTQRYPSDVEYAAFMVAREAVNNALRHARPESVWVDVRSGPARLELEVRDNGQGVNQLATRRRPGHLGLVSMRERAAAIDASLSIDSSVDQGTRVAMAWEMPA